MNEIHHSLVSKVWAKERMVLMPLRERKKKKSSKKNKNYEAEHKWGV